MPDHPLLAAYAWALNEAGHWATVMDNSFRQVFVTDELRHSLAGLGGFAAVTPGAHGFGPESPFVRADRGAEGAREIFSKIFPEVLSSTPGGRSELRDLVDPRLHDLVDGLPEAEPRDAVVWRLSTNWSWGMDLGTLQMLLRVYDGSGQVAGFLQISKPAAGMSIIGTVAGVGDVRHFERMQEVVTADRRPAAVLFADLEASSSLSRRLSTADYFNLARRLVRSADQCVVEAGGLVGRHLGDGVSAFFLAEMFGSESAAARAAIEATRSLRIAATQIAERSGLTPQDVTLRFGVHWGATLYVGLIKSVARSEVTALGDEVNETARIEACASGGRALASKALIERLDPRDTAALELQHIAYTPLGELATATDKARRDAPAIAVCEI